MKIVEIYSHLNGEEYLLVKQPVLYQEIKDVIAQVDAVKCMTKKSRESTMKGKQLYSLQALNKQFGNLFHQKGWCESRYNYYVTTERKYMEEMIRLPLKDQKEYLVQKGVTDLIKSYKQTDFVKERVAIEVQFGKYACETLTVL